METFHLLHLASVWNSGKGGVPGKQAQEKLAGDAQDGVRSGDELSLPPTNLPVEPSISRSPSAQHSSGQTEATVRLASVGGIRAAAVQMIFASRTSQEFITPQQVQVVENWSGKGVLDALLKFHIPEELLHMDSGSVWEQM